MKEDITNEYPVVDDVQSIQAEETLDNTQEDIPDEWLEELTGGTLGSIVLDASHGVSRISPETKSTIKTTIMSLGGGALIMTPAVIASTIKPK